MAQYHPSSLSASDADSWLAWARSSSVDWCSEYFRLFGKTVRVPRQVAWFGDRGTNYRYTGLNHHGTGWPSELRSLRDAVANRAERSFNFVLLNRYDSGSDYVGWHRDDEAGHAPHVASLSLGSRRRFRLQEALPGSAETKIELEHGSLLLFEASHRHTLPKTKRSVTTRVNLTFRTLM